MDWMVVPLRRYADFGGRSRRMEYWMFSLFIVLVTLAIGVFIGVTSYSGNDKDSKSLWLGLVVLGLFYMAIFIPSVAVQVRRFHDQDRSGWMVLLGLIPYVGGVVLLVFMCLDGTRGANRFGPDPKGRTLGEAFA